MEPVAAPAGRARHDVAWRLAVCGLGSLGLYGVGITWRYPLIDGLRVPRGTWVTLAGANWNTLGAHIAVYALLTVLYLLALQAALVVPATGGRRQYALIIAIWLACSGVLLGAYPGGESHDVFDYLFRGRMIVAYGANPLADVPDRFAGAPFYSYISWRNNVDTYGPLWEYASAAVTTLVGIAGRMAGLPASELPSCPHSADSCALLAASLTGYRLLAIGLAGLAGALIARMVKKYRPDAVPAALVAWLWNPVLLLGSALGAHNDALMLVGILAALALVQRRRLILGLVFVGLAAHVKLTALLIVPTLALWLVREYGWRVTARSGAAALALSAPLSWLLYAPLGGWATLPQMLHERGLFLANAPAALLYRWLLDIQHMPQPDARSLATRSATLVFGVLAVILLAQAWRPHSRADGRLWNAIAIFTLAYLLIGSFWFQHWYLLWALAPAALLPHSRLTRAILPWYAFGALSSNLAGNVLAELPGVALSRLERETVTLGITLAPVVLSLLIVAGLAWWSRRRADSIASVRQSAYL